jgi:hypothetical protein
LGALILSIGACAPRPTQKLPAEPTTHATGQCLELYSPRRCDAILATVAVRLNIPLDQVASLTILPDANLSIRAGLVGEPYKELLIFCGGISAAFEPACMGDEPHVVISVPNGPVSDYEGGFAGQTPVPTPDPAAVAAARPLRIASFQIDAGGLGHHEVVIGSAVLPNGVLSAGTFELANQWPDNVLFTPDGVRLLVRSADPNRPPFDNMFDHGWYPGTEDVKAVLVFDVLRATPNATFEIRNVVVE